MKLSCKKDVMIHLLIPVLLVATVFSLQFNVQAQGEPVMRVVDAATGLTTINVGNPGEPFPAAGFPFTVNVTLQGPIANFFAYQVVIRYEADYVNCTSARVDKNDPSFVFYKKTAAIIAPEIKVMHNSQYVFWGATLIMGPMAVPAAQYLLGQINFTAFRSGTSLLQFIYAGNISPDYPDESFLLDLTGETPHDIAFSFENCQVNAVGSLTPPNALFSFSPTDPKPLQDVAFDASASFDPDGTIAFYQWDFGDNTTGDGVDATHVFTFSASFRVTLTVFDNDGMNGSMIQNVQVGAAPFVNFTFDPAEPLNIDLITFNASLSYDPDGNITSYVWNFGDESNQTETNETTVTHQYVVRGVYMANLMVIDNDGLSNSSMVTILVGRRPVPDFYSDPDLRDADLNGTYGPYEYGPFGVYGQNETIGFDASTSKIGEEGAIDTFIVLYAWDFGDYSDQVTVNASDPSTFNGSQQYLAYHTYELGGGFNVNLTIYDNWGLSASVVKGIETFGEAKPRALTGNTLYYAVAGAVFAVVVVGAIVMKKRQKPESARKERYRVI